MRFQLQQYPVWRPGGASNKHPNADLHAHTFLNAFRYANGNQYSHLDLDEHSNPYQYTNGNAYPFPNADSYAYTFQYANS